MSGGPRRRGAWRVATALAAIAALPYAGLGGADFVSLDDAAYLYDNPRVAGGLSAAAVRWAFTSTHEGNWHPLTWLSHMLDVTLFGMRPGPHHLVNVALHAANAVLFFLVLRGMTGAHWRSVLAAALFAVHPLRVESVAWVAERKDLLCALGWMAAVGAHLAHARRPSAARLLGVAVALALALMAKPMAVTLPFALLLLDCWPLGRMHAAHGGAGRRFLALAAEKLPLVALSAASSVVALHAQRAGGAMGLVMALVPLPQRAINALVSCGAYLGNALWPAGLAAYYPYTVFIPWGKAALALLVLAGATAVALRAWRSRPWLAVGWLWFLGVLVPVLGLVQVGGQAMADRYTYLPLAGLFAAASWGAAALVEGRGARRAAVAAPAVLCVVTLATASWRQAGIWADEVTLYRHSLRTAGESFLLRHNLGRALEVRGMAGEALEEYGRALRLNPYSAGTLSNVGALLARQGRRGEAAGFFLRALAIRPAHFEARVNLATVLEESGDREGAALQYREALRLRPGDPLVRGRLERLGRPPAGAGPE